MRVHECNLVPVARDGTLVEHAGAQDGDILGRKQVVLRSTGASYQGRSYFKAEGCEET